jgi:LmbE family N-acetylglucosaminyl deacetylase
LEVADMPGTDRSTSRPASAVLCVLMCATAALQGQTATPATDTFSFRDARSRAFELPLTAAAEAFEIAWPDAAPAAWDTAILGVDVVADVGAPAPFVEFSAGALTDRQHFRPGDAGPRWLNLSALRGAVGRGARVRLQGDGVRLEAGTATLRLFANGLDLSRRLLVLAPHPDDAEIAAFGLYAHRNATIVTVTTGNAGPPSYDAVFDDVPDLYAFKGRIRVIDSITVPWLGGIPPERAFNMGYFDARLAEMHDRPTAVVPEMYGPNTDLGIYLRYNIGSLLPKTRRASTWSNLVDDLVRVLRKVEPAVVLAPHPQLDTHRDHQFTTVALAAAMRRWRKPVTLLLYTNHADSNRYPYGPAGTAVSLPPPVAQGVQFDRVYSHPVPPDLQRLKLFALESMHDLRVSPSRLYQMMIGAGRTAAPEKFDPPGGVPYLRRGPRSNELFFVYDERSVAPMVEAFLTAWRAFRE